MKKTKRKLIVKYAVNTVVLIFCLAFVVRFAGKRILQQYISYGIGNCRTIPILCMQPEEKALTPEVDKEYLDTLVPQRFPKLSVSVPKGFNVVQELITRKYYKRRKTENNAVIYLLRQQPEAFVKLYPDVRKFGINNNYEFIRRIMYANLKKMNGVEDAFFIIMKSIITPDIGPQNVCKMIAFELGEKKGFVNYTMSRTNNYFDCSVFDPQGNFFKIYIRDPGSRLDLNKVFTIISSLKPED
jgi:hypothetical protein